MLATSEQVSNEANVKSLEQRKQGSSVLQMQKRREKVSQQSCKNACY